MKSILRNGILAMALLCLAAMQGHAQAVSPRTGEAPRTQTLTLEQFNRLPQEVQTIMKQHPDRFIIDQQPKAGPLTTDGQGKAIPTQEGQIASPKGPSPSKKPDQAGPASLPEHPQQQQP